MATFLILCAGVGYRWHDYLGVRKHMLPLDGEPIVERTVRLLNERGHTPIIVGTDDDRYRLPGAELYVPDNPMVTDTSVDKLLSSRELWDTSGPTTCMWGDVWWSEAALDSVCSYDGPDWHVWYRETGSGVTGTTHGEFFAHQFHPEHHSAEEEACWRVYDLYKVDVLPWKNTGGWAQYRAMLGLPDDEVNGWHDGRHATLIDDWTDDFDMPLDYRTWYGRRAAGRYPIDVRFHGVSSRWRRMWPASDPDPTAVVDVYNDCYIPFDQLWCAVAHAVEWGERVVPYTDADNQFSVWEPIPDDVAVTVGPVDGDDGPPAARIHGALVGGTNR